MFIIVHVLSIYMSTFTIYKIENILIVIYLRLRCSVRQDCSESMYTAIHMAIHFFTDYCLEVDPDKRPDIFQVGSVAFRILGRQCAINTNLNVSLLF